MKSNMKLKPRLFSSLDIVADIGLLLNNASLLHACVSLYKQKSDIVWSAFVLQVMLVSFNFSSPSPSKINTNQSSDCSVVLCNNTAPLLTPSSIIISDHICVFQYITARITICQFCRGYLVYTSVLNLTVKNVTVISWSSETICVRDF